MDTGRSTEASAHPLRLVRVRNVTREAIQPAGGIAAISAFVLMLACSSAGGGGGDGSGGEGINGQGGAGAPGSGGVGPTSGLGGGAGPTDAGSPVSGTDASGNNMPPVSTPVAGVSIGGKCFPLCVTSGKTSGDYGYENAQSCVVAGTYTAMISQACTVGAPLPGHDLVLVRDRHASR